MAQTNLEAEQSHDPYDGIPLGAEALVPLLHAQTSAERNRDDDRPVARQVSWTKGWRG